MIHQKPTPKYDHILKGPPQDIPNPAPIKKYGKAAQDLIPEYQGIIQRQKKTSPSGCWKHTLLCIGCQHHTLHGPKHYSC